MVLWLYYSRSKFQPAPDPVGNQPPEEGQHPIATVNHPYMPFAVDAADDIPRHRFRLHQHGIFESAAEQGRIHEPRTDISKPDVQSALVGLLFQCLQIRGLQGFGCRVCRCRTKSFRSGYRRDGSDMSPTLLRKISVGRADHPGESHGIRFRRDQFDVLLQRAVLLADTRSMEIEIHPS